MDLKEMFFALLKLVWEKNYSDIHLNSEMKPMIRDNVWDIKILEKIPTINWEIESPILSKENIWGIIQNIAWEKKYQEFQENFELDISYKHDWERYRINCYIDSNWYSIAFRTIPKDIPSIESLWLWSQIKNMCERPKWLILVTWPTWSWKSTNLAAMINHINEMYNKHIITIEDPIEFVHKNKKSLINQREVWSHTKWFPEAIRASLREDPDVVMVWEMRDLETVKSAITLAETWHLVLSTLHTNDTAQTIDRVLDIFPTAQQKQIRMQLAMSLIWVISQRLIPRIDKEWRIACREVLLNNDAVKNAIISWKTNQIYSILETWRKDWMILMDKYLIVLYKAKVIDKDILFTYARDKDIISTVIREVETSGE